MCGSSSMFLAVFFGCQEGETELEWSRHCMGFPFFCFKLIIFSFPLKMANKRQTFSCFFLHCSAVFNFPFSFVFVDCLNVSLRVYLCASETIFHEKFKRKTFSRTFNKNIRSIQIIVFVVISKIEARDANFWDLIENKCSKSRNNFITSHHNVKDVESYISSWLTSFTTFCYANLRNFSWRALACAFLPAGFSVS